MSERIGMHNNRIRVESLGSRGPYRETPNHAADMHAVRCDNIARPSVSQRRPSQSGPAPAQPSEVGMAENKGTRGGQAVPACDFDDAARQKMHDLVRLLDLYDMRNGRATSPDVERATSPNRMALQSPSAGEHALVNRLIQGGWTEPFDWVTWQKDGHVDRLVASQFTDASLDELEKMCCALLRKERFCQGQISTWMAQGHAVSMLERMQVLLAGSAPHAAPLGLHRPAATARALADGRAHS